MSHDYKVLLSTNQIETGADLSFSECEQVSPALKAANSDKCKPAALPSWQPGAVGRASRRGRRESRVPAGAQAALQRRRGKKELGKPDLIGMGVRGILHAETSVLVRALQQPHC